MVIHEGKLRIEIANIGNEFRHQFFKNPKDPDLPTAYRHAQAQLTGIARVFPDGRINRAICNAKHDLFLLGRVCGCVSSTETTSEVGGVAVTGTDS